jgi:Cys-rich protein (TIGR01571 family)
MIFVWIMLNAAIFAAVEKAGSISDIDMYLFLGTNITFYLICVFITGNARRSIRNKYSIQGSFASDIFTSLFAMPLVVSQLGRHTVDCKLYSYKLWSRKGMYGDVEFTSKLENERKSNYVPPDSIENDDSYGMV